ncbi:RagB/SusD family nutrient uptake outer membrane protein [Flavobacterium granuli]|uniref:SusD family protein n=1 Tax=Flavobacterium granuli TaxID=280093 RepID=A0A1M5NHU4_9FLAO|nr:RagB/SusD family nutrient uptake outer membrane protein [Flavobacterium granuli]PRZ23287.1 SusD-like starch-binding protein associating with outer membrane [Flavobacterium granuli]SHG89098.1 SusD family protein [Flavobacterium granuli]
MKNTKIYYLLFCFVVSLSSCEEFVSVEVPGSQLSGEIVFEDYKTAEAVLLNVYTKMNNNVMVCGDGNGISVLLGNYTDELKCYGLNIPELMFYQNELATINPTIQSLWRNTYNLIYSLNTVIEGVENSVSLKQHDRDRLLGEALFVRAYLHFYLNELFGEIPYVTSTDYRINTSIGKQTNEALFSLLEDDLLRSESLLTDNYTGIHRVRPNKSTVLALQARLYLYHEKWELAKQKASMVINNSVLYSLVMDINAVFLRNSPGTIWQLMSAPEGKNTLDAKSFIFKTVPPPSRALQEGLVNKFEINDLRGINWVKSVSNSSRTFYHAFKYKLNNDTSTSMEYSIQFRLEEMYLIRAEANAELNLLDLSAADLNSIRNKAGLANTTALTKDELLTAILKERQLEFFTELGHRFFDLKRRGGLDSVLSGVKPGWNTSDVLFPLPENELLLNPNLLPQNDGH